MGRRAWALAVSLWAAGAAAGAVAAGEIPDPPLVLSEFGLERVRKTVESSNVVTAAFNVHAQPGADLSGLAARVEYVDFEGKPVARPSTARLGDLEGGKRKQALVSVGFVPQFNGYVVTITGRVNGSAGEWTFFGASGVDQPTYLPAKPIPKTALLVCVAHELRQPPRSSAAQLFLRVRNLGSATASEAACFIQVRGKDGKSLGNARAKLTGAKDGRAGLVNGGEERLFVMAFKSFPRYESYDVTLDWRAPPPEERLAGGEFENKKEIELAHFAFQRQASDVVITGDARNGLGKPVDNLRVIIRFLGEPKPASREPSVVGAAEALLQGRTDPDKVRPFRAVGRDVKEYTDFEYEVAFEEPGEGPKPVAAGDAVVTIRSAVRRPDGAVEIDGNLANAGATAIAEVDITFSFRKLEGGEQKVVHRVKHRIPGVVRPGDKADFKIVAEKAPAFDEYFYEVGYKPAEGK